MTSLNLGKRLYSCRQKFVLSSSGEVGDDVEVSTKSEGVAIANLRAQLKTDITYEAI